VQSSIHVVAAVIRADANFLCARRKPEKSMGGYWEFPGGKVEQGELPRLALERELLEELGLALALGEKLGETVTGMDPEILLEFYECELPCKIEVHSTDHDRIVWLPREELLSLEWASADLPFVQRFVKSH
jgi:8-oxo-dGTP diphosphatase